MHMLPHILPYSPVVKQSFCLVILVADWCKKIQEEREQNYVQSQKETMKNSKKNKIVK